MYKKLSAKGIIIIIASLTLILGAILYSTSKNISTPQNKSIKIGVSVYKTNDTFVAAMINELEKSAKEFEMETGIKVTLDISGAKESQRSQNDQIKRYISLNYDVICVNIVDRTNASTIIDTADDTDIPIVFFNREPVEEDIFRNENIYYVGTDAKSTGVLQGEILIDAYKASPEKLDKNGDGKLQYVMLEGEMGHQDALIRTEWSVAKPTYSGIQMELLQSGTANWERSQAAALMDQWLNTFDEKIEVVLCNNDDMALGALDSMEKAEITDIAVLGIDATDAGIQAVKDGKLLGTVECNYEDQGKAIFELSAGLALTGKPPEEMELDNKRYFRAELRKITK